MKRPRLTAIEVDAILSVAGAADAPAVFEDCYNEKEADKMLAAFERGMGKLRSRLAAAEAAKHSLKGMKP